MTNKVNVTGKTFPMVGSFLVSFMKTKQIFLNLLGHFSLQIASGIDISVETQETEASEQEDIPQEGASR